MSKRNTIFRSLDRNFWFSFYSQFLYSTSSAKFEEIIEWKVVQVSNPYGLLIRTKAITTTPTNAYKAYNLLEIF